MKKSTILSICIVLLYQPFSIACINEYRALSGGKIVYKSVTPEFKPSRDLTNKNDLKIKLDQALKTYQENKTIENYSDYAAELIYSGKYKEAEKIYKEIESKYPERYITYSNLGTLYELTGRDKDALALISKGYKINPNSHNGSEWIHIELLKEKVKSNGNDNYFLKNNILSNKGIYFGNELEPLSPKDLEKEQLEEIKEELRIQLQERASFVKPTNILVGQLFFELGNMEAILTDVHKALEMYYLSKKYGYSNSIMENRISHYKKLVEKAKLKENIIEYLPYIVAIALLFLLITFLIPKNMITKIYRHNKK